MLWNVTSPSLPAMSEKYAIISIDSCHRCKLPWNLCELIRNSATLITDATSLSIAENNLKLSMYTLLWQQYLLDYLLSCLWCDSIFTPWRNERQKRLEKRSDFQQLFASFQASTKDRQVFLLLLFACNSFLPSSLFAIPLLRHLNDTVVLGGRFTLSACGPLHLRYVIKEVLFVHLVSLQRKSTLKTHKLSQDGDSWHTAAPQHSERWRNSKEKKNSLDSKAYQHSQNPAASFLLSRKTWNLCAIVKMNSFFSLSDD